VDRPDEQTFATVTVYDIGGSIVWRGRFRQFPRKHGNEYTVEPGAEGWIAHLTDRKDARALYRDMDINRWGEWSLARQETYRGLGFNPGAWNPDVMRNDAGSPAIKFSATGAIPKSSLERLYDAGGGLVVESLYCGLTLRGLTGATAELSVTARSTTDDNATGELSSSEQKANSSISYTPTTAQRVMKLVVEWSASGGATGTGYAVEFSDPVVYGDHGLTLRGTEPNAGFYISDLVEHAVQTWAPKLNVEDIDTNTVVVPHVTFLDPTDAGVMVQTFNRAALWDYGVYGRERFFFRQSDPDRLTWKLRLDKGTTLHFDGATGDEIINGVCVFYPDPSGRTKSVGPVGALVDTEDASLSTDDASNPANKYGLTKHDAIQLSDPCVEETAILIGQLYLAQRSIPQRRGEVTVSGMTAIHPRKGLRPSFEIRAGDYVQIVDSNDDLLGAPRRVVDTDYEHDTRANQLTLDNRPDTVESLLALLGAELIGRA
jgi:hypothetical protein